MYETVTIPTPQIRVYTRTTYDYGALLSRTYAVCVCHPTADDHAPQLSPGKHADVVWLGSLHAEWDSLHDAKVAARVWWEALQSSHQGLTLILDEFGPAFSVDINPRGDV